MGNYRLNLDVLNDFDTFLVYFTALYEEKVTLASRTFTFSSLFDRVADE
jgi:hypothetical protein